MKCIKGGEKLQPSIIWKNFDRILSFPHPSKHEKLLAEDICSFGKSLGLESLIDEAGNVIIRKPASSPDMADRQSILLQSHIDMVPQKTDFKKIDFTKDPIKAYVDGDFVKAEDTTLGADNGIGAAAMMAILESKDIPHGPLEALFTVDEEAGMGGAKGLKPGIFKSKIMFNLDCDPYGILFIGCAGGLDTEMLFKFKPVPVPSDSAAFSIRIYGLKGGHSGSEIHVGRGNSIKLLSRLLYKLSAKFGISISEINGGTLRNVIPSKASATIIVSNTHTEELKPFVEKQKAVLKNELAKADPGLEVELEKINLPAACMPRNMSDDLIKALFICPNGVIRMDDNIPGLVETSSNLGVITTENNTVVIKTLQRSSVDSQKANLSDMISCTFLMCGANKAEQKGGYPGWKPDLKSIALKTARDTFTAISGREPEVQAIHAGLECAIIGEKYPDLQMVSFGPDISEAHSVNEKVGIASVGKFWELLCEVLKNAPKAR